MTVTVTGVAQVAVNTNISIARILHHFLQLLYPPTVIVLTYLLACSHLDRLYILHVVEYLSIPLVLCSLSFWKKEAECCSLLYLKYSCLCVCEFVIVELLSSLAILDMNG